MRAAAPPRPPGADVRPAPPLSERPPATRGSAAQSAPGRRRVRIA
ncbi:hypothetical protein chiPu_0030386, partial [Chiloscyllium punctatum]|nr:hypothetical protein [Chiloscyllium punctatum]